jgi:hypothetical protein
MDTPTLGGSDSLKRRVTDMLREFSVVFSNSVSSVPAKVEPMDLKRITGAAMPAAMRGRVRPQLAHHQKEIDQQVQQLLDLGVLVPCNEDYFSQVLLVEKADKTKRLCIDYRFLNKITEGLQWPLPVIPDLIQKIGKHKLYAILDLTAGYHQCALTENASRFTAFKTATGMYRFRRVPFGLKGAPSYFQHMMAEEVLKELINASCVVYIDDCLIWGDSEDEFLKNLRDVLSRFKDKNIKVKLKKCAFGVSQVKYLGHVVNEHGVTFSEERKSA